MKTYNIFTNQIDSLPTGKADFLLAGSHTKIYDTDDISSLIPTLDAEFITNQTLFSLDGLAENPNYVSSSALITRAVHNLNPFSSIEILDLGLKTTAKQTSSHTFGIKASDSIINEAKIDAKEVFAKGMDFGRKYELKGSYLILAQSIPCGTITAEASYLALGYSSKNQVSSRTPDSSKKQTIQKALSLINDDMSNFEKLSLVSDNVLLFYAGFLLEASRRFHIVLSGGIQMAACLLIADKLREDVLMQLKSDNITLTTTACITDDKHSNLKHLLSQLSYSPHAIYTDFSFEKSEIAMLREYDKEIRSDDAAASLAYANANKLTQEELLEAIELIVYMM